MDIEFREIELSNQEEIAMYYYKEQSRGCTATFTNNYLWSPYYAVTYAIVENMLLLCSNEKKLSFTFPAGRDHLKEAMDWMIDYFDSKQLEFRMHLVTAEQFARLEELYPNKFRIEYDRDVADYLYEVEKLSTLAGKKLHGKRNHINKFKGEYPDWVYEKITKENKEECYTMLRKWSIDNECEQDEEKLKELRVSENELMYMEELHLVGGLIRLQPEGEVIAFSIGEPCSSDTFVIHIEKAFAHIQGAYPMMNQQFLIHEAGDYQYVNREEDAGVEGLRKAKLSYRPAFLEEKGIVTRKL
ncbi:MAG: phosphatidylglycerol lysyltransferase domain-containing protein [Eubacteriales bacterium]